jgi:HSP20 family protein
MKRLVQVRALERAELERLRARVGSLYAALEEAAETAALDEPGAWLPPADLSESGEAVTVSMELPGVRAADLEVRVAAGHLRVAGRKRKGAPRGVITHLCSERAYGRFARTIRLRWPVRADAATAELKDGLLTVRLPKLPERRGAEYKIEVQSAE